ncbi:MAG: hypothetical protein AB9891_11440 [Anaerolineaceae bacterium]
MKVSLRMSGMKVSLRMSGMKVSLRMSGMKVSLRMSGMKVSLRMSGMKLRLFNAIDCVLLTFSEIIGLKVYRAPICEIQGESG